MLTTTSLVALTTTSSSLLLVSSPPPAQAAYGSSSTMELPNYIDFLIEKNKVDDPSDYIYKGPNRDVLLQRIGDASLRLKSIPSLVEQKKWSQVQGILTGPLGTLVQTMNQISNDIAEDSKKKLVMEASKKVKSDLIAISQAASKKDGGLCLKASAACEQDLEAFAKIAF